MGLFAIKQSVGTLWGFFYLGFARVLVGDWLPQGLLSFVASFLLPVLIISVFLFIASLCLEYKPRRWALNLMWGFSGLITAAALLQFFGLTRLSLSILNSMVPLGLVVLMLTLLTARAKDNEVTIPRIWIIVYVFFYGFIQSLGPLMHLDILSEHHIVYYGNLTHLVVDALVIAVILHIRAKKRLQNKNKSNGQS